MSGWLDLAQLGLAPSQKHQALLGAPKIVQCGERFIRIIKKRPPMMAALSVVTSFWMSHFVDLTACDVKDTLRLPFRLLIYLHLAQEGENVQGT
jgi:hypothetical protein